MTRAQRRNRRLVGITLAAQGFMWGGGFTVLGATGGPDLPLLFIGLALLTISGGVAYYVIKQAVEEQGP